MPYFHQVNAESKVFDFVNYKIVEDTNGFIWFAGYGGIARYDGHKIYELEHIIDEENSLQEIETRTITPDNHGGLWIGSYYKGLTHYNYQTQTYTHYPHKPNDTNSPASNTIRDIIVLENDDIWVASSEGVSYYSVKDNRFTHYRGSFTAPRSNYVIDMAFDNFGKLWLSTGTGLKILDQKNQTLRIPTLVDENSRPIPNEESNIFFRKMFRDSYGKIWLASHLNYIRVLDPETGVISKLNNDPTSGKYIHMSITQPTPNEIWVLNLSTGIEVFNAKTKTKVRTIKPDKELPYSTHSLRADVLFTDSNQNVWISYNGEKPRFHSVKQRAIQSIDFDKKLSSHEPIRLISLSEKNYLISSGKKLHLFDETSNKISRLKLPDGISIKNLDFQIKSLFRENEQTIWVGTDTSGIAQFNIQTNEGKFFSYEHLATKGAIASDFAKISDDELLISTSHGPLIFNKKSSEFTQIHTEDGKPVNVRTWHAKQLKSGAILIATVNQLVARFSRGSSFKSIASSTSAGPFIQILQSQDETIWALSNRSIYKVEILGESIRLVPAKLKNKETFGSIYTAAIDKNDHIWINGKKVYNPITGELNSLPNYNKEYGAFLRGAFLDDDGPVFIGQRGILFINVDELSPFASNVPIRAINFHSGKHSFSPSELAKGAYLSADSQEFSVKFSALNYSFSDEFKYEYLLHGYDTFWRTSNSSERRAQYTSLPPGQYELEIKARHKSGLLNKQSFKLPIHVAPKLYQTIWFKTVIAVSLLLLTLFLHKRTLRKKIGREREKANHQIALERAKMAEELIEKKNQLLADVSHELGTPLTILKLQVEALKDDIEEDVHATYDALDIKLSELGKLVSNIHQLAQSDVGIIQLECEEIEIVHFLSKLQYEMEKFIGNSGFHFTFKNELIESIILELDSASIRQVLFNLLENSTKYTQRPGQISFSAKQKDGLIQLSIDDSSPGVSDSDLTRIFERLYRVEKSRSRKTGGSGLGLAICKSVIEAQGGSIYAEHSSMGGLKVIIEWPERSS
ncbi:ATP-binding protein [Aliikangiella coralliicola]|nr:ATP-binding protein [Aliikangiella coralliicola]